MAVWKPSTSGARTWSGPGPGLGPGLGLGLGLGLGFDLRRAHVGVERVEAQRAQVDAQLAPGDTRGDDK